MAIFRTNFSIRRKFEFFSEFSHDLHHFVLSELYADLNGIFVFYYYIIISIKLEEI